MDVFLRVFQRPHLLEQVTNIGAYLTKIARNRIVEEYKRGRDVEFVPIDDVKDIIPEKVEDVAERLEKSFEQKQRNKLLTEAMGQLPAEDRDLLLLRGCLKRHFQAISDAG
jgi:RNA polymerase sigma factor (sigma-70 family)